jgi:hypothetical protein
MANKLESWFCQELLTSPTNIRLGRKSLSGTLLLIGTIHNIQRKLFIVNMAQ